MRRNDELSTDVKKPIEDTSKKETPEKKETPPTTSKVSTFFSFEVEVMDFFFKNSAEQISLKNAYKQSALEFHPDKNGLRAHEEKFKFLSNLYEPMSKLQTLLNMDKETIKNFTQEENIKYRNDVYNAQNALKEVILKNEFFIFYKNSTPETQKNFKSYLPLEIRNEFNATLKSQASRLNKAEEELKKRQEEAKNREETLRRQEEERKAKEEQRKKIQAETMARLKKLDKSEPGISEKYDPRSDKEIKDMIDNKKTGDFAISIADNSNTIKVFVKMPSGFVNTVSYLLNNDNTVTALGDTRKIFSSQGEVKSISEHIREGILNDKINILGTDKALLAQPKQQPKKAEEILIEQVNDDKHMIARVKLPNNVILKRDYEITEGSIKVVGSNKKIKSISEDLKEEINAIKAHETRKQFRPLEERLQKLIKYESDKKEKFSSDNPKHIALKQLAVTLDDINNQLRENKITKYDEIKNLLQKPLEDVRRYSQVKHEDQVHIQILRGLIAPHANKDSYIGKKIEAASHSNTEKAAEEIIREFSFKK